MQYHLDLMAAFRKRLNHMFLFRGNNKKTTMNVYEKYSSRDISTATYMACSSRQFNFRYMSLQKCTENI